MSDMLTKQGERNPAAILTQEQVTQIRQLYSLGKWSYDKLAAKFAVHRCTIQKVVQNLTWFDPHYAAPKRAAGNRKRVLTTSQRAALRADFLYIGHPLKEMYRKTRPGFPAPFNDTVSVLLLHAIHRIPRQLAYAEYRKWAKTNHPLPAPPSTKPKTAHERRLEILAGKR